MPAFFLEQGSWLGDGAAAFLLFTIPYSLFTLRSPLSAISYPLSPIPYFRWCGVINPCDQAIKSRMNSRTESAMRTVSALTIRLP